MKRISLASLLLAFSSIVISGQEPELTFFKKSDILRPFISEIRSTIVKCEIASLNKLDNNYYVEDYARRPFVEAHLGVDVPFFNLTDRRNNIKFSTRGYMGNTLLIDNLEPTTAPIINTDYFIGLQAGAIKYTGNRYVRNVGLKILPLFHESTHLGDEFALHGYNKIPGFRRVNVSFEAWEIAVVLNDPDTIKTNLLSVKTGFQGLWKNDMGYYKTDSLETKGSVIPLSRKNYEYYFQVNLQRTQGFLCSPKWMQVLSVEAANRLRLSYDLDIPEKRIWNFNIYFGYKRIANSSGRNIGFFARYYSGIIPNGQFRNTSGYRYAALSLVFD